MLILNSSEKDLKLACQLIKNGELIAFPTETVYGIGCIFDNEIAFKKLNNLKTKKVKKSCRKFYTIMFNNIKDVEKYAFLDNKIKKFLEIILPGAITVVLPAKKDQLPKHIQYETIGIRIPNCSLTLKLLKKIAKPILAPSLNREGLKPLKDLKKIKKEFSNEISAIIVNKSLMDNCASTVISLCDKNIKKIREGKISFAYLNNLYKSLVNS